MILWGKSRTGPAGARYDRDMRSRAPLVTILFAVGSLALPALAHAAIPFFGPIIPNVSVVVNGVTTNQNVCAAGWPLLMTVINNLISLLITLAIVLVAPLMIAWSGFLFVVNPVNAGGKEQAKKILTNTIVGIVISLCGWMIVDAIMAALYNPSASSGTTVLGTWSQLITSGTGPVCLPQQGSTPGAGLNQTPAATVTVVPAGAIPTQICSAATTYQGTNTSSGPGGGTVSCAWAVNNVLTNAGVANLDSTSVASMEGAITAGRGSLVAASSAVCGDIVIQAQDGHVGICLNSGCTSVISNSSSNATFSWISGTDFAPSYSGGAGRIYQLNN